MARWTHMRRGRVRMVPVGAKRVTTRTARASAFVVMSPKTLEAIRTDRVAKGNVLETARIAGIQAAKRTGDLIPLCHPLRITHVDVDFEIVPPDRIRIESRVEAKDRTGVEMEALTAATVAALTIYDMAKALDRGMEIREVALEEKTGGRSGTYRRKAR